MTDIDRNLFTWTKTQAITFAYSVKRYVFFAVAGDSVCNIESELHQFANSTTGLLSGSQF